MENFMEKDLWGGGGGEEIELQCMNTNSLQTAVAA
jgi:hypothetical protein